MDSDLKSQIRARGRQFAKRKFNLTENDFIELEECEESYLAGYRHALRTIKNKDNGNKDSSKDKQARNA